MSVSSVIADLFQDKGAVYYGDEAINQLQHALQAACLAEREGASRELIVAALLHDVGHLLGAGDEGLAGKGVDARHEVSGARFLSQWFGPAVTEPVRLHVQAKAYLCHVDRGYFQTLSPASVESLEVQGGVFDEQKARRFRREDHSDDAVKLRRWDDKAKDPAADTPPLDHYITIASGLVAETEPEQQ